MVGRTQTQDARDRARLQVFEQIGCLCCALDGRGYALPTVQHVAKGFKRETDADGRQHQMTYPVCQWHHLGVSVINDPQKAAELYGPSIAHQKKRFVEHYGTELQLVQVTDALVRCVISSNRRGVTVSHNEVEALCRPLWREIVQQKLPSEGWPVPI